jgi:hypothetical protein
MENMEFLKAMQEMMDAYQAEMKADLQEMTARLEAKMDANRAEMKAITSGKQKIGDKIKPSIS